MLDRTNIIGGGIVVLFSYIFGEHWVLFAGFLLLNVIDWVTGWMKSKVANKVNSEKGWRGPLKKIGYWLMILTAFVMSDIFIEIGKTINIDLSVTVLVGWFVLASLIVNEIRSIIENFVEAGYKVPQKLVIGLEVAEHLINPEEENQNEGKDN